MNIRYILALAFSIRAVYTMPVNNPGASSPEGFSGASHEWGHAAAERISLEDQTSVSTKRPRVGDASTPNMRRHPIVKQEPVDIPSGHVSAHHDIPRGGDLFGNPWFNVLDSEQPFGPTLVGSNLPPAPERSERMLSPFARPVGSDEQTGGFGLASLFNDSPSPLGMNPSTPLDNTRRGFTPDMDSGRKRPRSIYRQASSTETEGAEDDSSIGTDLESQDLAQNQFSSLSSSITTRHAQQATTINVDGVEVSKADFFEQLPVLEKFQIGNSSNVYYYGKNTFNKALQNTLPGTQILYRFELLEKVGHGSYGAVYAAMDHKTGQKVALKIFHTVEYSKRELKIFHHLKCEAPTNYVQMKEHLEYGDWTIIVLKLFETNLKTYITRNQGIKDMPTLRSVAGQLVVALIQFHRKHLIHNDLKPANILISTKPHYLQIALTDFSNSCFNMQVAEKVRVTPNYEAPEVAFGAGHDVRADIWSLGMTLAETYRGQVLLNKEGVEYLVQMTRILDQKAPVSLVRDTVAFKLYQQYEPLADEILSKTDEDFGLEKTIPFISVPNQREEWVEFLDFIRRCLTWLPADRLTLKEALRHPFLNPAKNVS